MNSLGRCVLSVVLLIPIVINAQDQQAQVEKARQTAAEERIKTFGLTEETLAKLKQKGVDVRYSLLARTNLDERVRAALSDCVIIGVVESIIKMPAPKENPFHSKVRIIVTEVLKGGDKDLKTVEILLESGPLSDSDNLSIKVLTDPEFRAGEEVLLFMHYPEKDSYFTTVYRIYFQNHQPHLQRNVFVVDQSSKFTVTDNRVWYHGIDKSISSVVDGVKEVDSLLKK
jgi:hypothetical protein